MPCAEDRRTATALPVLVLIEFRRRLISGA
jgi:hypothetical protein